LSCLEQVFFFTKIATMKVATMRIKMGVKLHLAS